MARRAGTSAATLAKYERGEVEPGAATLERIVDAVMPRRRRWNSLCALAPALFSEFERDRADLAWKWCGEVLDDEKSADAIESKLFVSRRPELTGDSRVDALVAALGEYVCLQRNITTPTWMHEPRICNPFWFVAGLAAFEPLALAESPPSFASRGIFVTRADLIRI